MREVEIPGGTAMLRDREDMKMRHRRMIEIASITASPAVAKSRVALARDEHGDVLLDDKGNPTIDPEKANRVEYTPGEAAAMLEAQDAVIIASLSSWTLELPLPTLDTLGDVPLDVYDALSQATRVQGADVIVGETSFETDPDRERPTGSSANSNGSSSEESSNQASGLTRMSELGGESTSSASSTG